MEQSLILKSETNSLLSFRISKNKHVSIPAFIFNEGENAMLKFVDFFIAEIRNPHTRNAYYRANEYFLNWCFEKDINSIHDIKPFMVGAYIEEFNENHPPATAKLHLSGIRRLFNFLVINQVIGVTCGTGRKVALSNAALLSYLKLGYSP